MEGNRLAALIVAILALGVAAGATAGWLIKTLHAPPEGCTVVVKLDPEASPSLIQAVRSRFEHDPHVAVAHFESADEVIDQTPKVLKDLFPDLPGIVGPQIYVRPEREAF